MGIKRHIPNMITLTNLFCGCCAVVLLLQGHPVWASWLVLGSGAADFFDGMCARAMRVQTPFGKELDSLADMVSFGFVPGTMMYTMLVWAWGEHPQAQLLSLIGFFMTAFAAIRLAKFNIDTRQSHDFIGLNTPAATLFVTGLLLIAHFDRYHLQSFILQPWFLYSMIAGLSWLMVSELRLFSFKLKGIKWSGNEIKIIFAVLSVLLLFLLQEAALSLIIIIYVLTAGLQCLFAKNLPER